MLIIRFVIFGIANGNNAFGFVAMRNVLAKTKTAKPYR